MEELKKIFDGLLPVLFMTVFFLCSVSPASAEKVQLTMWAMPFAGPGTGNILEREVLEFRKVHPETDIKIVLIDWFSAWDKISASVQTGQGPDIAQLGSTWVSAIASRNVLVDLTEKTGEIGGEKEYNPASWSSCRIAGHPEVWAVPWFADTRILFYRSDIFQKLGLSQKDIDDWQSFRNTCAKIKQAGINGNGVPMEPLGFPGRKDWALLHNFASWIWGAGGDFLSADSTKAAFSGKEALEGMSFIIELAEKGYIPRQSFSQSSNEVEKQFSDSHYAMIFSGPLTIAYLKSLQTEAGKNFKVALLPKGPAGRFAFFGGSNLAIFRSSRNAEKAWEFIRFLSSPESQTRCLLQAGLLPALNKAVDDPRISQDEHYRVCREAYRFARSYPSIPAWGVIESILTRHFSLIWNHLEGMYGPYEKKALKEEMDIAAQRVDEVLSEMGSSHGE